MVAVVTRVRMVVHVHLVPVTVVDTHANVNRVITNQHALHVSIPMHQFVLQKGEQQNNQVVILLLD